MNSANPLLNILAYDPLPKFGRWNRPAVIQLYGSLHRGLAEWALNHEIGCGLGCLFCNLPESSVKYLTRDLSIYGIDDPVKEWGQFMRLRDWDEQAFLKSLERAERTPREKLSASGHRAILMSTATDAYQVIRDTDAEHAAKLNQQLRFNRRRALELVRNHSTLNVRIHTRCSSVCEDFDLFWSFGPRLMFGMSLPTLRDDLSKIYEPHAPLPSERLAALRVAKAIGLNVFVVISPIYPECELPDIRDTLKAVAALEPWTIFCEPLRLRLKELERVESHANATGANLKTGVFTTDEAWARFAITTLINVHTLARELGIEDRVHLWPDKTLGERAGIRKQSKPAAYEKWLKHWRDRVSEWPVA